MRWTWFLLVALATAGLVAHHVPVAQPDWLPWAAAATLTVAYSFGLAARTGGRPLLASGLALTLVVIAVLTDRPVLLAAAAVSTAVLGTVLGVVATVPAARFPGVVRECLVATAVAGVAALAASSYGARLAVERAEYLALALGLLGTLALVYRLGAGFSGLGRRGAVVVVGGTALLAVVLAYAEALSRWGPPGLLESLQDALAAARETLGAIPRPVAALVGFPALAWGVSTRARRRQGWWPTAFGAAGLAVVSTSLLDRRTSDLEAVLETGYGVALGLFLGYAVIRMDAFLTGTRGRRARREEEASAHRPEPRRTEALL
ncbi:MAG TPA: hypothetical protein VFV40_07255 [Nocardioides sp.]|nr:hypothetical protein [Nocardioides sp.]